MSGRLFVPDGPAVTPGERRDRRASYRDAQQSLLLPEAAAIEDGAGWVDAAAPFTVWFDDGIPMADSAEDPWGSARL